MLKFFRKLFGVVETEKITIENIRIGDRILATKREEWPSDLPHRLDGKLKINPGDQGFVTYVDKKVWWITVSWDKCPEKECGVHYMPTQDPPDGWMIQRVKEKTKEQGIDVMTGREAYIDKWIVSISLHLMPTPAEWYFRLLYNDPLSGRQFCGDGLLLRAPITDRKEKLIHNWIIKMAPGPHGPKLPPWTVYQAVLAKVRELREEETKAREGHEFVKKIMAEHKAKQP